MRVQAVIVDSGAVVARVTARKVYVTPDKIHFAQESHQERGFAGASGATNDAELSNGEVEVEVSETEGLFVVVAVESMHDRARRAFTNEAVVKSRTQV
ncbi:hypothetical protein BC937DRAFT_90514 [Endogone sp. FLAS-F59071]|nr:hypothetical protein BC937DRAFT_90514 [Endogone sp. FLAS-F59071]|eukprot:RUS17036.1 hypothetical protein BC937DRAFT_90514 [Endogone sp. FLAS-F59071]